jgi:hypothetical protein
MAARGEGVIHAKSGDIHLLFTNRALLNAERQLSEGILDVLNGFISNKSGYTELVALLRVGVEAARQDAHTSGRPVTNSDAIDIIDEVGFAAALTPVVESVSDVISYSQEDEDSLVKSETDPN